MRRVVASLFTTLDGVVETPEKWHFPFFNEEMGAIVGAQMSDTLLMGRKATTRSPRPGRSARRPAARTPRWRRPWAMRARSSCRTRRWSSPGGTPGLLHGESSRPSPRSDPEPGSDIAISGSISIVRQLLDAGLIDELQLLVDPIAVRDGRRLFEETGTALPLELLSSRVLTNGVLYLVYGPVGSGPDGNYRRASKAMAEATKKA